MAGKDLKFKLVMEADSKSFVTNVKQSESAAKQALESIKSGAAKIVVETEKASSSIEKLIPANASQRANTLTQSLGDAAQSIKDAGDGASDAAVSFEEFGNKSVKQLSILKANLATAKTNLEAFAKTKATPQDLEIAKNKIDALEKEVQQADQAFKEFKGVVAQFAPEAKVTAHHVSVLEQSVNETNNELKETRSAANQALGGINGLKTGYTALAGVLASLGVGLGVGELVKAADSYTNLSAQITIATQKGGDFESAMAGVHQVALATNSTLDATAALFTRMNAVGKEVGYSQEQALKLTQTITQAIQVGGGSAEAADAAVMQFIQAMQGGVLRGEEFNSIMEGGIGLADALARGLGVTTGELRKMAENGELSSERVVKALSSQSESVQELYNKFPTTIGNALQRIATQWQILIGEMDQANGASATVAQWLVTLADNMDVVEILLKDIGEGFVWVGDQLKKVDVATIEALKTALSSAYDTLKSAASAVGDGLLRTGDLLNTLLGNVFKFSSGIDQATDNTNGFTKAFQALNVVFGFLSDGFSAITIVGNLLTGVFYDLGAAWQQLKSRFTWGEAKEQAIAEMNAMAQKAQEYYNRASQGALDFESKGVEAWRQIGLTQEQKNTESITNNQKTLDQLKAQEEKHKSDYKSISDERVRLEQQLMDARKGGNQAAIDLAIKGLADLSTKEKDYQTLSQQLGDQKLQAAQAMADAMKLSADAVGMAELKVLNAKLAAQGLQAEFDNSGKVIVSAMTQSATSTEVQTEATTKARKAATALGLDLDVALNRVSEGFKSGETNLNTYAENLQGLGAKGEQAANAVYLGWQKWLESAKNQAEIDAAKQKLIEFEKQGVFSTKQVELGMHELRRVTQELPSDLNEVEQAFERLGIKTKEQLKLAAQIALADFETVRASGQATQEQLQQAYEKTIQLAYASGDAQSIAAANSRAASLGLKVQVDETGKTSVTSMNEVEKAVERVGRSFGGLQGHARDAGKVMREEAKSSTQAWSDMLNAMSGAMHATPTGSRSKMAYDESAIVEQLKAQGYDEKRAKQLAKEIYQSSVSANGSRYKNVSGSNSWSFSGGGGGMSNVDYVDQQIARYAQYAGNQTVSTGSSISAAKNVNYQIQFDGQTLNLQGDAGQEDLLNQLVSKLQAQAKST